MLNEKQKKISKLVFGMLLFIGLGLKFIELRTERIERDKLIKDTIINAKIFDKDLWNVKTFSLNFIESSESDAGKCQMFDVLYKIELKESCWVNNKRNESFWHKNSIVDKILELFSSEENKAERAIFKEGNCFGESYLKKQLDDAKTEQYKTIGTKVCTSYRHIIFGGGCAKEVTVSKEMVDGVLSDLKESLYSDVEKYPKKEKGYQIPMTIKADYCKNNDKKTVKLISE